MKSQCFLLVFLFFSPSAESALFGRLPYTPDGTGFLAFYDTELDITWLTDANYASTSGFDLDGAMTWDEAQLWVSSLNDSWHLGVQGWRLPEIVDVDNDGCVFSFSGSDCGFNVDLSTGEMAHLYYATLGNLGRYDPSGVPPDLWGLQNSGPFSNIQHNYYWSGTEHAANTYAWEFDFEGGQQNASPKSDVRFAWAVVDGDIGAIPIPGALYLFAAALVSLAPIRYSLFDTTRQMTKRTRSCQPICGT